MDIRIVRQQALLVRVVEIGAVVDGRLFSGGTAKDFRFPCVEVRVEVDDADRAVGFINGTEKGKRDCVVAAEGYDAWESFLFEGGAGGVGGGHG